MKRAARVRKDNQGFPSRIDRVACLWHNGQEHSAALRGSRGRRCDDGAVGEADEYGAERPRARVSSGGLSA